MRCPNFRSDGFALAMVLWLVALLALMALSLGAMQRTETASAANLLAGAQARAAAQAGLQLALLELMRPPGARQLTLDGAPYALHYGDAQLQLSAVDEAGKVDLNFASGPLLDALMRAAGVTEEGGRVQLVDAILDWRDSDELRRVHGAERDEYQAAGLDYVPRNGPFQCIEELSLVLGMSAPLYQRIAGSITIFSGASSVDSAAAALNHLTLATDPNDELGNLTDLLTPEGTYEVVNYEHGTMVRAVTLRSESQLPDGARAALEAVVRLTPRRGNAPLLYEIVVWREVVPMQEHRAETD